jgi:hypothetical protein
MEFINVGVLAYDESSFAFQMMGNHHLSMMHCSFFIDKTVLENFLGYFSSLLADIESHQEFVAKSRGLYFDNFSFSKEMSLASMMSCKDEVSILFHNYVGHKFERQHIIARKESTKISTKHIIDRRFKQFSYTDDDYYDIVIHNNAKSIVIPTVFGSIISDNDLSVAFKAHLNKPLRNAIYCHITSSQEIERHKQKADHARAILHNNLHMNVMNFSDESNIVKSLESIAV